MNKDVQSIQSYIFLLSTLS